MMAGGEREPKRRGRRRGRQVEPAALAEVRALLGDEPRRADLLIEHLHRIQDRFKHLSAAHIAALAHEMRLSQAEVYEVASFYHHFDPVGADETPPPPVTVRVCDSLTCSMFGAHALLGDLVEALGDAVRIQAVSCIGRCQHAPVAVVDTVPVHEAGIGKVEAALLDPLPEVRVPEGCIDYAAYVAKGGYRLLAECLQGRRHADAIIAELEGANLRGLGGAGFPAGRKWRIVRGQSPGRFVAVNIDEGEPGTFKDRHYLERDPHRLIEGCLIAAWVVEAEAVYLYCRDEYAAILHMLARELEELRKHFPMPLPAVHLRRGAGAYICGEESAMLESLEGRRGVPRLRPPYIAERGLFGRPTLEHNVETLYWVRDIVERGAEAFCGEGRRGRRGLRSFSVSGRVKRPGLYLAPAGISAQELIDEYCGGMTEGERFYGYFPGGASGGILPASLGDIPLDFDTLEPYGCFIGSAAVVVFSEQDSARQLALNAMRFFARESCGQCTPCRAGTAQAVHLMEQPVWDLERIESLCTVMQEASICGLGQAAPNPIRCAIRYFPEEFE